MGVLREGLDQVTVVGALILLLTGLIYFTMPVNVDAHPGWPRIGIDWKMTFRPACWALLTGHNPYALGGFFNAPWVLLPLVPIALLSPALGTSLLCALNLIAFLFVAWRLQIPAWLAVPFVLFAGPLQGAANGNIEGLIALGLFLPPWIGLFAMLAKPQIGIAVAGFWIIERWRSDGWRGCTRLLAPVTLALIGSFLVFGFWPAAAPDLRTAWWNASLWPWGIPIGATLSLFAVWRRNMRWAIGASPFLAPYLTGHTWAFAWLGGLLVVGEAWPMLRARAGRVTAIAWTVTDERHERLSDRA